MTRNHTPNAGDRVHGAMNHQAPDAAFDPMQCRAAGCPCTGTIDLGSSGRFLCAWHAWAPPERADALTLALRREQGLLDLIAELQALHRDGGKGAPWVVRARQAWGTDEALQPTEGEARHWNLYLWRLREEVSFRVGLRADAPAPRVQHCADERFAAMFRPALVDGIREAA